MTIKIEIEWESGEGHCTRYVSYIHSCQGEEFSRLEIR